MPVSAAKIPSNRSAAQLRASRLRAAKKAEEAAKILHSFAGSLIELDSLGTASGTPSPTPRNWWRLQSGRFKNDPTFAAFVAQVQASRKQESLAVLVLDTDALSLIQRGSGARFLALSRLLDDAHDDVYDASLVTGNMRGFANIPMLKLAPIAE